LATQSVSFAATNTPINGVTFITAESVSTDLLNLISDYNLQIGSNKIAQGAVIGSALATSAITLGYAQITSATTFATSISGLSTTVTVPAGGRNVKITGFIPAISSDTNGISTLAIFEGATQLASASISQTLGTLSDFIMVIAYVTAPSAGSHTYLLQGSVTKGTTSIQVSATAPAFILVEAI